MPITGMGISTDSDSVFRLTNDQITVETRTVVISQATTDRVYRPLPGLPRLDCDHSRAPSTANPDGGPSTPAPAAAGQVPANAGQAVVADVRSRCDYDYEKVS
jgi:hypothetical protein